MTIPGIDFEQGPDGLRAVVIADQWAPLTGRQIAEAGVRELVVEAGTRSGSSLDFLIDVPFIERLRVPSVSIRNDGGVRALRQLRELELQNYGVSEIDFASFPHLEKLTTVWRPGAESALECEGLRSLSIRGFPGSDLTAFRRLVQLRQLDLVEGGLESTKGIERFLQLEWLRLGALRKLSSLRGVDALVLLRELRIVRCRRISSLAELSALRVLKLLFLEDLGTVGSASALAGLTELQQLGIIGDTNIEDGDLEPVSQLPLLEMVSMRNRRHYSHQVDVDQRLVLRTRA